MFGGQDLDHQGRHNALHSIEVLDLASEKQEWQSLGTTMSFKAASPGLLILNQHEILIFGGWNKNPNQNSCILREKIDGEFEIREGNQLEQADNFLVNGIRYKIKAENRYIVFGQKYVHELNELREFKTL